MKNPQLFAPGPTPIAPDTLSILSASPLHHRSEEFTKVIEETLSQLPHLFDETHHILLPSTGSGGLEAAVTNFLHTKETALYLNGGKFGERWGEILDTFKVKNEEIRFPWGSTPPLEKVAEFLEKFKPQALLTQACETSTATYYDLKKIKELLQKHSPQTLFIVDGITAVGAYELSMKDCGVDVLISGSQKALGLPTGLCLMGISQKAYDRMSSSNLPKYYFDLKKEIKNLKKNTTTFSTPTQLWLALNNELKKISKESLKEKFTLNLELQKLIFSWSKQNQISVFSDSPSPSLTALSMPEGISAKSVQEKLLQRGYFIAVGQDEYKDLIIRIGHMANISIADMSNFLSELTLVMKELSKKS